MESFRITFIYDKSFDGLLTAVFESFEHRQIPDAITGSADVPAELWNEPVLITTDCNKSDRVWYALVKCISSATANRFFRIHYSGIEGIDLPLFRLIRKIFEKGPGILENHADPDVLAIKKADRRVSREAERVAQFVRFQKTADNIYFAAFEPDYDVIPMVLGHFRDRFADQRWIIYDMRRKKGYYYNGHELQWVTLTSDRISSSGDVDPLVLSADEILFQRLWQQYFRSICIDQRLNLQLHRQKIPKKYWKYLTEKKQ
ncbi:MAG: TIGR03915 family putative DNA repair protein [Bacteroidales bacterium]|nr:TIGR03915 family putative DNA repair protein [Bacteroidales bacterium]